MLSFHDKLNAAYVKSSNIFVFCVFITKELISIWSTVMENKEEKLL